MKSLRWVLFAVPFVVFAGCNNPGQGIARLDVPPCEGDVIDKPHLHLEAARIGTVSDTRVWLVNEGDAPFRVEAIDAAGPLASELRLPAAGFEVGPGERVPVDIGFAPSEIRQVDPEPSKITFALANAQADELSVRAIRGHVLPNLSVTPRLDMGEVAVGTTSRGMVEVTNSTEFRQWISVRLDRQGIGETEMTVPEENLPVGAHMIVSFPVTVSPVEPRPFSAVVHVVSGSDLVADVPVTGEAVPYTAACDAVGPIIPEATTGAPCRADFGFVAPGAMKTADIVFRNAGTADATVEGIAIEGPADGETFALGREPGALVIPAGGNVRLQVNFSPRSLGSQRGTLHFRVGTLPGAIELVGFSGGPDIDAVPASIDFGPITSGTYQYRRVTIANVGAAVPGLSDGVLWLAVKQADSWVPIRPELVGDAEFSVEVVGANLADGIAPGQTVDVRVKFAPTAVGDRHATLVVYSNDPDEPVLEVPVAGSGADATDCEYEIVPPKISCGTVEPGKYRTMSLYFVNTSAVECVITSIAPTADSHFGEGLDSVVSAATVPPFQTLEIPIRFESEGGGTLVFQVMSRSKPETRVSVHCGDTAPSNCLRLSPSDADFSVPVGARRETEFHAFNVCPTSDTIDAIQLRVGTSPEFSLVRVPQLPITIASGEEVSFTVAYEPVDSVDDFGAVEVHAPSLPAPYVVTLSGSSPP